MIVELLIGAALVAAGAATARVLVRRRPFEPYEEPDPDGSGLHEKKVDGKPARRRSRARRRDPRGYRVGDVLLHADAEMWLAGKLELDEEGFVMRLFVSPGSQRGGWVAQLDPAGDEVATLTETDEVPAGAVPEALPVGGRRLRLERRGHARVRTEGEHLPRVDPRARFTVLSDTGGRMLVVLDFEKAPRLALLGDRVPKHMIDLLPGGDLE